MDCSVESQCPHSSPLFGLPRELRNLIWEHAVVRETIPIECAVAKGPGYRKHTGFPCTYSPQLHDAYPLARKVIHRTTWPLPIHDLKVDIQGGTWMEPKQAWMTYQLAQASSRPNYKTNRDKITIQLLQLCRAINSEASPLFYNKNVFSFTGAFPISTAFIFLQDRPVEGLSRLSSVELLLTEDNNMRGTAEAHFPPTTRSSDCLVLQHAYHYFTDLCILLSSPTIHLRRLYLTIESLSSYGDSQPESLPDCLTWEHEKSDLSRPWNASWVQPLLKIKSLEEIGVYWVSDRPRVRRMSDTLSTMQEAMLKQQNLERMDKPKGHALEFSILRSCYDLFSTTIVFDPRTEDFQCGDCSCEDRLDFLEHIVNDTSATKKAFYRCGVATWKEHQTCYTGFRSAYTAHCQLGSSFFSRNTRRESSSGCMLHIIS
ncbi:hypothetical protein B5807_08569 [Epicoccum nigrum]|uniref:DUF7730 domain-containing protein n=1 Tax=Epicoccum nigrum TaxID=105696 RepID=A0A1Y2LRW7_EPING|nr:hypothetical protein B5807_08569 [Epicoccum nigrum]